MIWKEKMFRDSRCIVMHEYWSMTIDHEIEHRCRERIANWQGGVRFDSPNRWIGFAGEEAFNALLYRYEIFGDWVSKKPNTRGPLDFIVAPQPGTLDGVNEKGLAITINYAFVTDPGTPNPEIGRAHV